MGWAYRSEGRKQFQRRRRYQADKDVDSINKNNEAFNRALDRNYNQYTTEIKANLERGANMALAFDLGGLAFGPALAHLGLQHVAVNNQYATEIKANLERGALMALAIGLCGLAVGPTVIRPKL